MLFYRILILQKVGLERPQFFMFRASFLAAFQHCLKNRGGGRCGGKHSFLNHTSQHQNLFSIATSNGHGADWLSNFDILEF